MTRRTKRAYAAVFQFIESEICKMDPDSFMTDYEQAMRNAIREKWPNCELKACYFHFTQAVRKYASIHCPGFLNVIVKDNTMNRLFHKFLVLPLLPATQIDSAFVLLKAEAQSYGAVFKKFIEYFEAQWIVIVSQLNLLVSTFHYIARYFSLSDYAGAFFGVRVAVAHQQLRGIPQRDAEQNDREWKRLFHRAVQVAFGRNAESA